MPDRQLAIPMRRWLRSSLLAALLSLQIPWAGCEPAHDTSGATALAVTQVQPGVFVHFGALEDWAPSNGGDVANLGFVVGSRCVAVIDTGGSPAIGQALRASVERATMLPVCYVINTHAHPDHVLGNIAFADVRPTAAQFVASVHFTHAMSAREPYYLNALQRDFGIRLSHAGIVYPTLSVDKVLDLDLGDRILTLQAWPTAHTDNDLTAYDHRTRTLFASDLLFVQHLPVLDGSLRGWLAVVPELKRIAAVTVVPGHGAVSQDGSAAIDAQTEYLDALLRDTRAAIRNRLTIQQAIEGIGVPPGSHWRLADRFQRRNVTAAYAELEWEDDDVRPPAASPAAGSARAGQPDR